MARKHIPPWPSKNEFEFLVRLSSSTWSSAVWAYSMPDQPKLTKQVPSEVYVMVARKKGEPEETMGAGTKSPQIVNHNGKEVI